MAEGACLGEVASDDRAGRSNDDIIIGAPDLRLIARLDFAGCQRSLDHRGRDLIIVDYTER
jgi:hypothetical protein